MAYNQQANSQEEYIAEENIDLRHYWRVLIRYKWNIVGLSVLFAIVTALVLANTKNIYESSVTLLIESNKPNITSIEEMYGIQAQSREYFNTQFELLKNRSLAERVIEELDLLNNAEFIPDENTGFSLSSLKKMISGLLTPKNTTNTVSQASAEQKLLTSVLKSFDSRLTISPIRNTDLVNVIFESTDPQLAADISNTLANAYIESYLEQRLSATQQASGWMTERLSSLKDTLNESEEVLQAFLETEQLVDIQGINALNIQELDELTTQNNIARQNRAEAETLYRQIQQLQGTETADEILTIPAILNHPSLERVGDNVDDIQQQLAELSQRYGRKHPRMIALNSELDETQRTLEIQIQQVIASIQQDHQTAIDNERLTQERLDGAKQEFQNVSRTNIELAGLQREVDTNRQLYDTFFTRIRETDETDSFQATPAIIVDPAVMAIAPSKPQRTLMTAVALVAGLMMGVILAFVRDMLDNTVHTPADIEERIGSTTLGIVPFSKDNMHAKEGKLAYLGFAEDNHSSFSEAFRTIRTGMMLSSLDKPYNLIAVTSSVPNEGKTTISINLSSVMGQMKKVLLIDADMRRPAMAKSLGVDSRSPGLSNLMAGTAEAKDCIYNFEKGNFSFMPGGQIVANPLEILSSHKFTNLLDKLGEKFDQIIIDTPPTQAVSDSLVIGSIVDAVIYVVKADSTPINVIKTGMSRLHYANANVIGVTLNQVDTEKQSSYYYYGGYYDSYGYSSKKETS